MVFKICYYRIGSDGLLGSDVGRVEKSILIEVKELLIGNGWRSWKEERRLGGSSVGGKRKRVWCLVVKRR